MKDKAEKVLCECCGQRMPKKLLHPDLVREFLSYDPEKGILKWNKRNIKHFKNKQSFNTFHTMYANKKLIGHKKTKQVYVGNVACKIHRVIWCHFYGEWPDKNLVIDHINGDDDDNRITNLRLVTQSENVKNQSLPKSNTSGAVGVIKHKNKWKAQIKINGVSKHIGIFENFNDAVNARKKAEIKHGFHENHGR